jgi:hypothetical protein
MIGQVAFLLYIFICFRHIIKVENFLANLGTFRLLKKKLSVHGVECNARKCNDTPRAQADILTEVHL